MEELLIGVLDGLVGGRVFPDVAEPLTLPPYITYQAVGGDPLNFTEGSVPDSRNSRVQVNVWAATRLEASDIAGQVEDALREVVGLQITVLTRPVWLYEPDTKLRGTMQDFSVWN